jgi:hypothetical protein
MQRFFAPRVVFFHVPKCAGSTVFSHLEKHRGRTRIEKVLGRKPSILLHSKYHADSLSEKLQVAQRARLVYGHFDWGTYARMQPSDRDFRLTFLRDPIGRLKSSYNYFCSEQGWKWVELEGSPGDYSFKDYLRKTDASTFWQLDNVMVRMFGGNLDQPLETDAEWEALLSEATRNLDTLQFVGFQETFQSDIERLCKLLNIEGSQVATKNPTARPKEHEPDAELLGLMKTFTKWDQKLCDHARKRFEVAETAN